MTLLNADYTLLTCVTANHLNPYQQMTVGRTVFNSELLDTLNILPVQLNDSCCILHKIICRCIWKKLWMVIIHILDQVCILNFVGLTVTKLMNNTGIKSHYKLPIYRMNNALCQFSEPLSFTQIQKLELVKMAAVHSVVLAVLLELVRCTDSPIIPCRNF